MGVLLSSISGCFVALLMFLWLKTSRRLPPGPPALPFIGNMHQYPKQALWQAFDDWHRRYGPIICLRLGSRTVISLGSMEVAKELLGKRGRIYGTRPGMTAAGDALTGGLHTGLLPYGDRWRRHNRIHLSLSNPAKIPAYREIIDIESMRTLCRLLEGRDLKACFVRYTAGVLWKLAYGRTITWEDAGFTEMQSITEEFIQNMTSPNWLQESFPFVKRLQGTLMSGSTSDEQFHHRATRFFTRNFEDALRTPSWNLCKHIQETEDTASMTPSEVSYMLGVFLEGSIDSTAIVLQNLVLALIQYPEAARKAQSEIDTVVGLDRLPDAVDLPQLPYTHAFLNEVLRWRPVTPQGVPHGCDKSDTYDGYYIPKDSIVLFNHWSAHVDDAVFDHAQTFDPDRWICNQNLPLYPFGLGRRSCPGQSLARATLHTIVPRLLWALSFEPVDGKFSSDLVQEASVLYPKHLNVKVKARNPARGLLLQQRFTSMDHDVDACLCRVQSALGCS